MRDVGNIAMMIADKTLHDSGERESEDDDVAKLQVDGDRLFFETRWPPKRTKK